MPLSRRHGFRQDITDLAEHLENADSYTYAAYDGEYIKVGKSRNHPMQRVASLSTGNPRELKLIAYSVVWTERQAHQRLRSWRIRSEWFRVYPEVLRFIETWCFVDCQVLAEVRTTVGVK